TIGLSLNNQQGVTVGVQTITVPQDQQISIFVTQMFPGNAALSEPFAGLLFISADIPVGVLGLAFTGPSFTSLPVATQLTTTTVTTTTQQPQETFTSTGVNTIPPVTPIPPVTQPISPLVPVTITQIPSTFTGTPQPIVGTTGIGTISGVQGVGTISG